MHRNTPTLEQKINKWLVHFLHDAARDITNKQSTEKRISHFLARFQGEDRKMVVRKLNKALMALSGSLLDFADVLKQIK